MYLGSWKIDDTLVFTCNTHTPSSGAATDADAVPTYRVYEDETTAAILTGSTTKLDDANTTGYYSEQITLSAANGLEKGKTYTIYISAAVGGVTGTMSHSFQIEAEVDANIVSDKTGFGLAADQSAVTVGTVTTLTGHTVQTGDNYTRIGAAGVGLTNLGGMSIGMQAEIQSEANDAIVANHLDHLLAADYNPASKPGVATALLNELIESDGGVSRYTANALEQAPDSNVLVNTTLTLTDQTHFVLTSGSNDDDAYKDQAIVVYDTSDSDFPSVRKVSAYTGATKTITLDSAPDFVMVTGDGVKIFVTAPGTSAPTAAQNADAVWDELMSSHTTSGSFGNFISKKLLTVAKYLGLK